MKQVIDILVGQIKELVGRGYGVNVSASEREDFMKATAEILKVIDKLCDKYDIEFPDEAIGINAELDDYFGEAIL